MMGEPVAREILLEAADLMDSDPRAGTVLAVTAAEVGLKSYMASRDPATGWLITEAPWVS
jgi:hypothetical protein